MNHPIRAFIVSDLRLLVEGIADLVAARKDFVITGSATAFQEAEAILMQLESAPADVILLYAAMVRADAAQIIRRIKQHLPEAKFIVLGLEPYDEAIVEFIEAGAVGYVLKDASVDELFNTIAAIHNGQSPCSSRVAASIFNRLAQLSRKQRLALAFQQATLTSREKDILRLMSAGLCNREIALHLNIALYTVKNHVHNILEKLEVCSRKEAVKCAFEKGILNEGESHAIVHQNIQLDGSPGSL